MTCIIALKTDDGVFMGADSQYVWGESKKGISKEPKVFRNGEYMIGVAGAVRDAQLIRYADYPNPPVRCLHRFMCIDFADAVRAVLRSKKALTVEDKVEYFHSVALIVVHDRIFKLGGDCSITESDRFASIGSGSAYAMGALAVSANSGADARTRIRAALKVAGKYARGVSPPYKIWKYKEGSTR